MGLKITQRNHLSREAWDTFVHESDDAWMWHLSDIQDAMLKWPGRTDVGFVINDEETEKIVAMIPLQLVERPLIFPFKKRKFESVGGLALAPHLTGQKTTLAKDLAFQYLRKLQEILKPWETVFSIAPMTPSVRGERCPRVNPLLELGFSNRLSQTWIVDLRGTEKDIAENYTTSTDRKVRKGNQQGYKIREASGEEDAEIYYNLHRETYRRSHLPPHPEAYFKTVFTDLLPKGLCRFIFCENNGRVIAGNSMAIFKGGAYYWTGASVTDKQGTETQFLMNDQIMVAKRMGCSFFDCGEGYPQYSEGKLKGMSEFKRGFGGTLYPLFRGRIASPKRHLRSLASLEGAVREIAGSGP